MKDKVIALYALHVAKKTISIYQTITPTRTKYIERYNSIGLFQRLSNLKNL